jgi:hypothetical protein
MEACCGAHHLGRVFAAQGHEVRLMSPEYVRPYVKAQKNDDLDAEAIAEAASRPTMRFVEVKSQAQSDIQALHRARERNVSFVSVTQQFSTTTSMGRLTLNMLLSFAQFEREIAGERIRDKIAASKRKGMWMGGNVPLGYGVKDRKLVVNEPEASTVGVIFRRYAELGSVALLGRRKRVIQKEFVEKLFGHFVASSAGM